MAFIFDLDGTVLDSSHRQLTAADGSLDIAHWRANSTPNKVLQDKPLPLAAFWRQVQAAGHTIAVCTARVMSTADYALLRKHGLYAHHIISRPHGETEKDHTLKKNQLAELIRNNPEFQGATMFDDNANVRLTIAELGIVTVDPVHYNEANS